MKEGKFVSGRKLGQGIVLKTDEKMKQYQVELIDTTLLRISVLTTRYKSKSERDY